MKEIKSLGICVGASSVSYVYLSKHLNSVTIISADTIHHNGNPAQIVQNIFTLGIPKKTAVTGKKFRNLLNLTSISEAEAVELSAGFLTLSADIIISAGGENFIIYILDKHGKISKVAAGNKCASGTGEFFLQQIKRMDMDVTEAVSLAQKGEPYNISGRCSVFCKSDCTHALNKGISKADVAAGLSRMLAQKIIELTSRIKFNNAVLIGGASKNKAMLKFLDEHFPDLYVPPEAPYFEALGAALYAMENPTQLPDKEFLFRHEHSAFSFHRPLKDFTQLVKFQSIQKDTARPGDTCIIGLDVGSTTTKIVLMRKADNAILASQYLRTNGDPIYASVECYKSLRDQVEAPIKIIGLGVTGSGRHISGLHALTRGIINEIIAHASATVYFDHEADTIFEIGGQDAKYTFITAGVASDYAMNEACSAGTGSFLEEAAKESLGIDYTDIGEIALSADNPPNFNDQCSAFISSDIKNALHEGLSKENIIAGLVYSICMNYSNRVRGNRTTGRKIFMQGGVCYNKAVPVAMAALTGKEIIVPPEPGLMGAFGVALEINKRLDLGLLHPHNFSLDELINRKVNYEQTFICAGGAEKCDRKCSIRIFNIDGKKYPFGGACNKYFNLQVQSKAVHKTTDYVKLRQHIVFEKYIVHREINKDAKTIGISKSFLSNTYFPLYYNFFTQLGFKVILSDKVNPKGIDKKEAAFCYPVELAHGFFQDLIDKNPDYIFLPHIKEIYNSSEKHLPKKTCVLLQSETYYLRTTFRDDLKDIKILSPVLDFSSGYGTEKETFIKLAQDLGKDRGIASAAFDFSLMKLEEMFNEFKFIGQQIMNDLENDKDKFIVVLFGRSYNAFAGEANLGIPQKFASRNVDIVPYDFLSCDNNVSYKHMFWGLGQQILKAARFVKNHPRIFGTFITNFSCGPDSFIIGYFRNIMGKKPSLTLELDSHSADAGINTRIEAFIDITSSYLELEKRGINNDKLVSKTSLLRVEYPEVIDSDNHRFPINHPSVKMLIPSMGRIATRAFSAAFRYSGINSEALDVYTNETLVEGRGCTSCKECLPLILCSGSLVRYYNQRKNPEEKTLLFMAESFGPCRLGQYHVFLEDLISKKEMKNIGVFTMSDEDSYAGLGNTFQLRGWMALAFADVAKDIYNAIRALAVDRKSALSVFNDEVDKILHSIEFDPEKVFYAKLHKSALVLSKIEKKEPLEQAKKIALTGEIFVRHEEFSGMDLTEKLIEKGFIVKTIPIGEYIYYSNFLARKGTGTFQFKEKLLYHIKKFKQRDIEKKIKKAMVNSGFIEYDLIDIEEIIRHSSHLINPSLDGEALLTVGAALKEIMTNVCGVIALGPFGCMPSRVAESILNTEMNLEGKLKSEKKHFKAPAGNISDLPFLAVETDGNLFPQIIQSKIEIFMLQAERLHQKLQLAEKPTLEKYKDAFFTAAEGYFKKDWQKPDSDPIPQYDDVT